MTVEINPGLRARLLVAMKAAPFRYEAMVDAVLTELVAVKAERVGNIVHAVGAGGTLEEAVFNAGKSSRDEEVGLLRSQWHDAMGALERIMDALQWAARKEHPLYPTLHAKHWFLTVFESEPEVSYRAVYETHDGTGASVAAALVSVYLRETGQVVDPGCHCANSTEAADG